MSWQQVAQDAFADGFFTLRLIGLAWAIAYALRRL